MASQIYMKMFVAFSLRTSEFKVDVPSVVSVLKFSVASLLSSVAIG